jgi:hypothetical protein
MKKAARTHSTPPAPPAPPARRRVSIADDEEDAHLQKRQIEEDVGEMARRAAAIFSSTLARTSLERAQTERLANILKDSHPVEQAATEEVLKRATPGLLAGTSAPPLRMKKDKKSKTETAGPGWFDLPATPITPELKRDLHILNLRAHIDKSRKYKKGADPAKKMPKYFQVAEVIPSAQDYYRPGLARKDRVKSIAEQLLASSEQRKYRKRKFLELQQSKSSGGKAWFKAQREKRMPSWKRPAV